MLVKVGIRVWFILEDAKFGAGDQIQFQQAVYPLMYG